MDRGTVYKPSPHLPWEQPEPYTAGRLKDQQTGFPVPVQHLTFFSPLHPPYSVWEWVSL